MEAERSRFGFTGIAIGAVALLTTLVHFWAGPFAPQPSIEQTVVEKAAEIGERTIAALRGDDSEAEPPARPMDLDRLLDTATALLGGIAIVLGVLGYARKEPIRVAGGSLLLGTCAIAFQFAALAIGALVLAILIAAAIWKLNIG